MCQYGFQPEKEKSNTDMAFACVCKFMPGDACDPYIFLYVGRP